MTPDPDLPSQARPDRTTPDPDAGDGPPFDPEDRFGNPEHLDWIQELEADDGEET